MDTEPTSVNYAAGGVANGSFSRRTDYQYHFGGGHTSNSYPTTGAQFKASNSNGTYKGSKVNPLSQTCHFAIRY